MWAWKLSRGWGEQNEGEYSDCYEEMAGGELKRSSSWREEEASIANASREKEREQRREYGFCSEDTFDVFLSVRGQSGTQADTHFVARDHVCLVSQLSSRSVIATSWSAPCPCVFHDRLVMNLLICENVNACMYGWMVNV